MKRANPPIATYRIQFNPQFRFVDCRDLVPYLHELGVGGVYSSPRFRANRGSSHGYDVANPARINSELGNDEEFDDLCQRLQNYGMGLVLDIVPNHMAASHENQWWMDVLEHGEGSRHAHYFDIDWHPAATKAAFLQDGKILLPILGDIYGNVLDNGELSVHLDERGFFLQYFERRLPLDPSSYASILDCCSPDLQKALGADHEFIREMSGLRQTLAGLPSRSATDPDAIELRAEISAAAKTQVFHWYREHLDVRLAMDAALYQLSGGPRPPRGSDCLHEILNQQAYRLAFWKIAYEEINYRRFFDINDLVCLRVEAEDVFNARHDAIFKLIREGKILGLRVDHVDGLLDPQQYLARLREGMRRANPDSALFTVVEKILARDEELPASWPASGTTGYDFLNALNDIFIRQDGLAALQRAFASFAGEQRSFEEISYASNKQVMWKLFSGEVYSFGHHLGRLAALDRHGRDVPVSELLNALVEVTACLPVYRTYISGPEVPPEDRAIIEATLALARRRTSHVQISDPAFGFIRRVLLLDPPAYSPELTTEYLPFVMRWQQFSGPVMAKGLEDTANYVSNSLISRNEVGADSLRVQPPIDLAGFHAFNQRRLASWPYSMNATSTHDTKRSEDVRARLNVLSELAPQWERRLLQWSHWNHGKKTVHLGRPVPTPAEEILLYQTFLGALPLTPAELPQCKERLKQFALKATREARVHSGWIHPDEAHEAAVLRFIDEVLEDSPSNRFLPDLLRFRDKLAWPGAINSLSQVLIKTTAPGVPDFYQGTELWDWSLVDPDNRRPVDFRQRVAMLKELRLQDSHGRLRLLSDLVAGWRDGAIKLFLADKALDFRRQHANLFLNGSYIPIAATGPRSEHIVAFARRLGESWAMTIAPRWSARAGRPSGLRSWKALWEGTALTLPDGAPGAWRNVLTGQSVSASASGESPLIAVEDCLAKFPVALLEAV
jgi:(1->4)-alpha-D-glucan 1-alpha-D-glucosylmutase